MSSLVDRWKPGIGTRNTRRLNAAAAAEVVAGLVAGRATLAELVERSGLCVMTVRAYVKAMHKAGAVHIAGWDADKRGAYTTPRWSMGRFGDVPKPPPLNHAARQRAQRRAEKLRARGCDVRVAALMGRPIKQPHQGGEQP